MEFQSINEKTPEKKQPKPKKKGLFLGDNVPVTRMRYLDAETKLVAIKYLDKINTYLYKFCNEPSVALYRVCEHARMKVPRIVRNTETIKKTEERIQNYVYACNRTMKIAGNFSKVETPLIDLKNKMGDFLDKDYKNVSDIEKASKTSSLPSDFQPKSFSEVKVEKTDEIFRKSNTLDYVKMKKKKKKRKKKIVTFQEEPTEDTPVDINAYLKGSTENERTEEEEIDLEYSQPEEEKKKEGSKSFDDDFQPMTFN